MAKTNPAQFLREVKQEVSKVTWPTRKETVLTTIMVFIMVLLATMFAEAIREQAEQQNMSDRIEEVLVPTEEVMELRRGQKVSAERKFFPGYVLVKMELNDDTWHLVKNTPKVTGFLGGKGKPVPMSNREAEHLIKQVTEGVKAGPSTVAFEIGEQVRVADGRLKVAVSIFGRSTPVELEFSQVQKQ